MWSLARTIARGTALRRGNELCQLTSRGVASAAAGGSSPAESSTFSFTAPESTLRRGLGIVHSPLDNKGTGFSLAERDRLRIRGLVPPRMLSLDVQARKIMAALQLKKDPLEKHAFLMDLADRNSTLFYRILIDNLEELAPIVYTPTVGEVCMKFGEGRGVGRARAGRRHADPHFSRGADPQARCFAAPWACTFRRKTGGSLAP